MVHLETTFVLLLLTLSSSSGSGDGLRACCSHATATRLRQSWDVVMASLDGNGLVAVTDDFMRRLDAASPMASLFWRRPAAGGGGGGGGRLARKRLQTECLREMGNMVRMMEEPRLLQKHVQHLVDTRNLHPLTLADVWEASVWALLGTLSAMTSEVNEVDFEDCLMYAVALLRAHDVTADPYVYARCRISRDSGEPTYPLEGDISFKQMTTGSNSTIHVQLSGFNVDDVHGRHGFHIHTHGRLGNQCKDAGGHFNPEGRTHGAPSDVIRHVGDLGNVEESEQGTVDAIIVDHEVTLLGKNSVIGRSIVVHAHTDDLGTGAFADSRTTGHAGGRLACCVIEAVSQAERGL